MIFAVEKSASQSQEVSASSSIRPGVGFQKTKDRDVPHFRVFGGFGISAGLVNEAPASSIFTLIYQNLRTVLSASIMTSSSITRDPPRKNWVEFDLLYGLANTNNAYIHFGFSPDQLFVSASAGIGFFSYQTSWRRGRRFGQSIDTDSTHVNSTISGIGVPFQIQISYSPFDLMGIGLSLFANLNTKQINYGVALSAQIFYF